MLKVASLFLITSLRNLCNQKKLRLKSQIILCWDANIVWCLVCLPGQVYILYKNIFENVEVSFRLFKHFSVKNNRKNPVNISFLCFLNLNNCNMTPNDEEKEEKMTEQPGIIENAKWIPWGSKTKKKQVLSPSSSCLRNDIFKN